MDKIDKDVFLSFELIDDCLGTLALFLLVSKQVAKLSALYQLKGGKENKNNIKKSSLYIH